MSKPVEVIESKRWKHTTGKTASIYGAMPWTTKTDEPNWHIETVGYTLKMSDGTVGYGRQALPTHEEAQVVMDSWLARIGG